MMTVNWGRLHAVVDRLDRAVPSEVKRTIKRRFPGALARIYTLLAQATPAGPQLCTIQGGPLQGRSLYCSLKRERTYFVGNYEPEVVACLVAHLRPGDTMLDVGGHFGYLAMVGAILVGSSGRVVTFEPSADNRGWLHKNLTLNPDLIDRVIIESSAISATVGEATFATTDGSSMGQLSALGEHRVATTTIDAYVAEHHLTPRLLKLDIEGGETKAFDGMLRTLQTHRPFVIVELHNQDANARCVQLLAECGYVSSPPLSSTWNGRTQVSLSPLQ